MSAPPAVAGDDAIAATPTAAQRRIIDAAVELFARHGVGGTSLQMIADEIGVTKAAVYHQYRTKDEIVLAVAEAELALLREVVAAAEAARSRRKALDTLVRGIVDLAIDRGRKVSTMLSDPVIGRFFLQHEGFREVMHRMRELVGTDANADPRIRTAMLIAAVNGAATQPFVAELDDDVVRAELLRLARRFLGLPS